MLSASLNKTLLSSFLRIEMETLFLQHTLHYGRFFWRAVYPNSERVYHTALLVISGYQTYTYIICHIIDPRRVHASCNMHLVLCSLGLLLLVVNGNPVHIQKPHIVFIVADDLGMSLLTCVSIYCSYCI